MSLLLLLPAAAVSPTAWKDSWNTALAGVATTPATVVCIGDSVTEGQGASLRGNRWIARLSNYLHARYPVAVGGEGYVAAQTATGAPDSPWYNWSASTGTNTFITTPGNPGYRALSMALNATLTYTVVGTSVDIWWVRSVSGGSFTYKIDGGSATTVSTAGAASTTQKTTVSLGAAGTHTVLLTCTIATTVISGLTVYNGDETKGVRVYEAGHTAWDTNQYLNHSAYADLIAFITALAPDLVTVQLGINDWGHNTVTTTAYKTNLLKLMASLDALPKRPSILLIDSYDLDPTGSANSETQDQYKAKVIEVVNADPAHRGFLDFGTTMPFATTSGTGYYSTDGIHPNDSGHIEIARQVINTLTPDPNTGATTLATETWTGTTGAAWPAQWTQVAQTGTATIQSNIGRLLPGTGAYAVAPVEWLSGMTATVDFDITIDVGFHTSALEQYVTVGMSPATTKSTNDVAPSDGYFVQFFPGSSAFGVNRCNANVTTAISGDVPYTYTLGTRVNLQFTRRGANLEVYVWNVGAGKPGSPTWSGVDSAPYNSAGKVWLGASNGAATTALTATFDNLTVTDAVVASPSPLAPGQPTGLTATPQPGQVVLAWNQPTDAGSYTIYRAGVAIATGVTALTYTDLSGVQGTTYAYTVSSVNTVGEGPQSSSASAASTTLTALTTWKTALTTITTAPAKLLAIGDSVTEGQGASVRTNRWLDKLRGLLRTAYPSGVTGGENYLPAGYFVYAPDSTWGRPATTTGTVTYVATSGSLGYRTAVMAAAATWSLSVTGTSVDIWYATGGTLTYQIDGGTGVPIDTSTEPATDGVVAGVSLGAAGAHTVKITATTGTVNFEGLTVYNGDTAAGVQVYDSAHTSFTSANHIADGSNEQQIWASLAPDLAFITLGLNDAGAMTVAQFKSNLQIMINYLKGLPKIPSIMLIACYTPDVSVGYSAATYQTYVQGMKDLATADPSHVTCLDLSALMPAATTAGTGFYRSDGLHPNDSGHIQIANLVSAALASTNTATVAMVGTGALTVTPLVTHVPAVAMSGAGTLAVTPAVTRTGVVTMAGAGTLAVTGTDTTSPTVTMAGAGGLSVTGTDTLNGAVTMAGSGALTVGPAAGAPTTSLIDVGENHYTNSTQATTVQTLTNQVHVATVLRAFFKFDLPAAPSGGVLFSAALVGTTTSTGGSVGTNTFSTCSNSWSESTITWNTQPAPITTLGTLAAPAISTTYVIPLDPTVVAGFAGSTMSIVGVGDNADSTVFWSSRYVTDTTKRPDLQLVYLVPNATINGTVNMDGAGALTVTAVDTVLPAVAMAGVGSLTVAGVDTITGTVGMSGAGTLTVAPSVAHPATVGMTGAGTLTVAAAVTELATVAMTGSGTLTVTPTFTRTGVVAMAGAGTLTVTGADTTSSTVPMVGSGTLTVTGSTSGASTVNMTGTGGLTVTGSGSTAATVTMTGAGALTVTSLVTALGVVALTGVGTLAITPTVTRTGAVTLAGVGALTVTPLLTIPGTVLMSGAGVLTVTGSTSGINTVAMVGVGTLTVTAAVTTLSTVTFTGAGTLNVTPLVTHTPTVTMTGTGALTVTAAVTRTGTVNLAGVGTLTVTSTITRLAVVPMVGIGTLTITTTGAQSGTLTMTGAGALTIAALVDHPAMVPLTGAGTLTITATTTAVGVVPLAGAGTLTIGGTQSHPATVIMSGAGVLNITGDVLPSNTLYNVTWNPGGAPHGNPYTVGATNGNLYTVRAAHGNAYSVKGI